MILGYDKLDRRPIHARAGQRPDGRLTFHEAAPRSPLWSWAKRRRETHVEALLLRDPAAGGRAARDLRPSPNIGGGSVSLNAGPADDFRQGAAHDTIIITAFERSPDGGKGLARDTRVRWALEEVGQPYKVRLVSFGALKEPAHLKLHPFGQIPTYEEGGLALFETGAIVLHIAERHPGLLPDDANARARAYDVAMIKSARRKFPPVHRDVCAANFPASVVPAEEAIFSI